jgi:hypothetical protein
MDDTFNCWVYFGAKQKYDTREVRVHAANAEAAALKVRDQIKRELMDAGEQNIKFQVYVYRLQLSYIHEYKLN